MKLQQIKTLVEDEILCFDETSFAMAWKIGSINPNNGAEGLYADRQAILGKLRAALLDQDKDTVGKCVDKALEYGIAPMDIMNRGLADALQEMGELFAEQEIFLPELLLATDITLGVLNRLEGILGDDAQCEKLEKRGTVLICTVEGDVHDIGKSLVGMVLKASGYAVIDAGKNIPNSTIIKLVKEYKPDLVVLSALLSTTMNAQAEFVQMAKKAGIRDQIKIMVGGAPVSRNWAMEIGADGFSEDASEAVAEADRLLGLVV